MKSKFLSLALVCVTACLNVMPVSAAQSSFADTHTIQYIKGLQELPPLAIGATMKDKDGNPCESAGFTPLVISNAQGIYSYSHFVLDACSIADSATRENYQTLTITYSAIQNVFIDCNFEYKDSPQSFSWTYKPLNLMDLQSGINLPFIKDMELPATLSRDNGDAVIYYKETYSPNKRDTCSLYEDNPNYDGGIYLYQASTGFTITIDAPKDFDWNTLAFYVAKEGTQSYMIPVTDASELTTERFTPFLRNEMDTNDYYFIRITEHFAK